MEHDLELFSPILEILEIGVCNIIYNPGNIGKRIFPISHILEILDRTIHTQFYPGNIGSYDPYINPILEIVDRTIQYLLIILKTFNIDLRHFIYKSIYFSYVDHDFLINQPNKTNSNPYNSQSSHAFKTNAGFKGISS